MPIDNDRDIILKRSGRRARLEITPEDLAVAAPRARRPTPAPRPGSGGSHGRTPSSAVAAGVVAAALAIVVVAVIVIVGHHGGHAAKDVDGSLAAARGRTLEPIEAAGRATTIRAIAASGGAAAQALPGLTAAEADIRQAEGSSRRDAALGVVLSERAFLRSLSELRSVDRSYVTQPRLLAWTATRRRLVDARESLARHAAVAERLDLGTGDRLGLVPITEVNRTLARLTHVITEDHSAMMRYQARMSAYRRAKRAARARAGKITAYGQQVGDVLSQYASQRKAVSTWVHETVPAYAPEDGVKARDAVSVFRTQRGNTLSRLQDLEQLAPTKTLAAQAKALEAPINLSLQGLDFADQAIDEFAAAEDPAMSLTDATTWHAFVATASDAAGEGLDSAVASWNKAIAGAAAQVAGTNIPVRPSPPRL